VSHGIYYHGVHLFVIILSLAFPLSIITTATLERWTTGVKQIKLLSHMQDPPSITELPKRVILSRQWSCSADNITAFHGSQRKSKSGAFCIIIK